MEELITNHSVAILRIEDCKVNMKICKEDIDQGKICPASTEGTFVCWRLQWVPPTNSWRTLGDRISGCHAKVQHVGSLNDTHNRALSLEIKRV